MGRSYSPLRYPGGKSKLIPYISELIKCNGVSGGVYVEPFAGGAAIAWYLLSAGSVDSVYLNDLDPAIYAFWFCVINRTDDICERILDAEVNIEEWGRQRSIYSNGSDSVLDLGFSAFFLNRTNRSGIIKGGVIGGKNQDGNYKLNCRFNKKTLVRQIRDIADRRDRIHLFNMDGAQFLDEVVSGITGPALVNIDPPYFKKGPELYKNHFSRRDHMLLADCVRNLKCKWVITYDDTPEIEDLYKDYSPTPFALMYTAQEKRKGTELIIHGPNCTALPYQPDITFRELRRAQRMGDPCLS